MSNKILMAIAMVTVKADLGDYVEVPAYHREGWPASHETTAVMKQQTIKDDEKKNWWFNHAKPMYESANDIDQEPPAQGQVGK
jgi:hypothetical protein